MTYYQFMDAADAYAEKKGDNLIIFIILAMFIIGLLILSYKAFHNHKDEEI